MSSSFIKNIVEGAKRQNTKPIVKKTSISKQALAACCTKYEHSNALPIHRDISIALLLFAEFFRFSELAALPIGHISLNATQFTIKVAQSSKTDQYRKGDEVAITRSVLVTCISCLHMTLAGISASSGSDFLFRPLIRSRYKVISKVKPLSYTRARESIVGLLREFVLSTDNTITLACIHLDQGLRVPRLMPKCQAGAENVTAGGDLRGPRMVTSRILSTVVCASPNPWVFDFNFIY